MQSLGALMSPHRIKSSRFFQTRLSNPPRIIAFVRYVYPFKLNHRVISKSFVPLHVIDFTILTIIFGHGRLETRTGAEEVIERLHGRMVRGWNDPGSRISVRFADTSEQRELRVGVCLHVLTPTLS